MKKLRIIVALLVVLIACDNGGDDALPMDEYSGYTLVWSDEFNSNLNLDNWTYELGNGTDFGLPPGWGNMERQLYTNSVNNSAIIPDEAGNSVLAITAREEGLGYSSAKLTTRGLQSFRFGRIEARIKVPTGRGIWPAFWMLGDNFYSEIDWPGCGEIDIMEVIGHEPNVLHCSAHWTNSDNRLSSNTESLTSPTSLAEDYHVYRVDWTPTEMTFSLDSEVVQTTAITAEQKEFLRSFYIIFNVAVGGNWPGDPDETTEFPQQMLVDWVRVYQQNELDAPPIPPLDVVEETIGQISFALPQHALNSTLNQFPSVLVKSFGNGGEPDLSASDIAIEGDSSLMLSYPGSSWGGAFFELDETVDMSSYASGKLFLSLKADASMVDIELKLESVATAVSLFLVDYQATDLGNGFVEYEIPMSDFVDLDLTDIRIPFALWNPKDANDEFWIGDVIVDNIYFEE